MLILVNQNNMESRKCLECNEGLIGRKDQKFCSDYCRNTFNNRLNEDVNANVRRINRILKKNRRIISELLAKNQALKQGVELAEEGFNFHYYTNIYQTQKGQTYYFCYDLGYFKIRENKYKLVEKLDFIA